MITRQRETKKIKTLTREMQRFRLRWGGGVGVRVALNSVQLQKDCRSSL